MLAPQNPYDHQLHATCAAYMDSFESVFPSLAVAKPLYSELLRIWDASPDRGLDRSVIATLNGDDRRNEEVAELRRRAKGFLTLPKVKAMITGIPELLSRCFSRQSDLGECMDIIAADRRDEAELVKGTLAEYLIDGTDQLDPDALAEKIDGVMTVTALTPGAPPEPDLDPIKAQRIAQSKVDLAAYLEDHPIQWTDGEYYSITAEKQQQLTGKLMAAIMAQSMSTDYHLTWNSTGDVCREWTLQDLSALAFAIDARVTALVSYQQTQEVAMRDAATLDELDAIAVDYDSVEVPA